MSMTLDDLKQSPLAQLIYQQTGPLTSDLLLLSGGVSAGKYDIVERVLADCGAEFFFDRVRIQPGQPAVFGQARGGAPKWIPPSRLPLSWLGIEYPLPDR